MQYLEEVLEEGHVVQEEGAILRHHHHLEEKSSLESIINDLESPSIGLLLVYGSFSLSEFLRFSLVG